jgi:preprotein translocase subunit SecE
MAQANSAAKKPGVFSRIGKYFKDVRTELRRVIWPGRTEVINSSVVVVVTLLFFILFTMVVDNISSFLFLDVLAGIGR